MSNYVFNSILLYFDILRIVGLKEFVSEWSCESSKVAFTWNPADKFWGGRQKILSTVMAGQWHWKLQFFLAFCPLPRGQFTMLYRPSNTSFRLKSTMRIWLFWCNSTQSGMTRAWKLEKLIYLIQLAFKFYMHVALLKKGMNPHNIWVHSVFIATSFLDKDAQGTPRVVLP